MKQLNLTTMTDSTLEIINGVPMMGSRNIADMTGKDHSSVIVRDIKNMLKQLNIYPAAPQDNENKSFFIKMKTYNGREVIEEIFLDQGLSTTLVTGYSVQERYKVIKRWSDLESGKAQPRIAAQPAQPESGINPNFIALTRTVTEATASAMMKSAMEITGIQAIVHVKATVTENYSATNSTSDPASFLDEVNEQIASKPQPEAVETTRREVTPPADSAEYVQVTKISWETTFSDAACRRLIGFAGLPTMKYKGSHGLLVHRESFMLALRELIEESTPPTSKLKRWQHPEFRGFELKKDPKEIFGETE